MATTRKIDTLGLEYVRRFTNAYKEGSKIDIYRREMLCEDVQFPAILVSPKPTDLLCGKRLYPEVGYSVQYGGLGYYFDSRSWEGAEAFVSYEAEELQEWKELQAFWATEATHAKAWRELPSEAKERLADPFRGNDIVNAGYALPRMAGLQLDYGKLVNLGLPGLRKLVKGDSPFSISMQASISRVERCLKHLLDETNQWPDSAPTARLRAALSGLLDHAPQTFHEALQLILLVQTMSSTINFGRLDTVLGPILCRQLDDGSLPWAQALELMQHFYAITEEEILHFDARIIVGGQGRENEAIADRFALLAMEATDSLSLPMPQVSLRFYEGQNPALLEKAYDVIGHGKTFPMLYNDDVNVPAVVKAFGVDRRTAEQYVPFGCGEYIINHRSSGTPNLITNLTMTLELAMNHGKTLWKERRWAPDFGGLEDYSTFEDLWQAYTKTTEWFLEAGALGQDSIYRTTGRECPFSLISLLYDDCIARGRSMYDGGVEFLGGTNETYGNNNTADSLTAIQELVYLKKTYTREQLLVALKANWKGFDSMFQDFKGAPKYGNDDDIADAMVRKVHNHVCQQTSEAAKGTKLHHFLVVVINNNTNTIWGKTTSASADGRKHGEPLAPGNSAGAGADKKGLTALLNSQAKPDPSIHAGAVQNVKLSASFPEKKRTLYHALFAGYWKQGGAQTMVTVTKREDLVAALEHPENYANLLVRVGGFSARFVDLDPATQQEILSRTEHAG